MMELFLAALKGILVGWMLAIAASSPIICWFLWDYIRNYRNQRRFKKMMESRKRDFISRPDELEDGVWDNRLFGPEPEGEEAA